jgi:nucleoside-diphosphate-sugar epimerase
MKKSLTLPLTDIDDLTTTFIAEFRELAEVDFVIVGATGFLGRWLSTYFAMLRRESVMNGTLTLVVRDLNKLAELGGIRELTKCKIVLSNSISESSFSHLEAQRAIVIYGATSTSTSDLIGDYSAERIISLPRKIVSALPNSSVTFVHLSSGGVYLPEARQLDTIPADFEVQTTSDDPYTFEKIELERWTASESEKRHFLGRNPRLFTFYGPGLQLDRHFAIAEFMRCGLQGNPILIKGNPRNLRSYLYPTDAIKQILRQTLITEPQYSQIGSSDPMTILSVAQTVADEFGVNVEILESRSNRRDNYIPSDVPISAETEFNDGITQWAKWLKLGVRNALSD